MKQSIRQHLSRAAFALAILFSYSCASTYKSIVPSSLQYSYAQAASDSLLVSYKENVQAATNNMWYHKKELKFNMTAIAVKIENTSTSSVLVDKQNFKLFNGDREVTPISPVLYTEKIRQRTGRHLLHALYGPWGIKWESTDGGETDVDFYYIPVGAAIGIGNAVRASNANKKNSAAIFENQIWGKEIEPGKTLYGLITIPRTAGTALSFHYDLTESAVQPVTTTNVMTTYPLDEIHFRSQLSKGTNMAYNFYVILNDTRTMTVASRIFTEAEPHYIQMNGATAITPSQTTSISRMDESGRQILGIPHGNIWLFKMISGRINTYYVLSEGANLFTHIQKDDGPIVPFHPQALKDMVQDDPSVVAIIEEQGKFLKAIKRYNKYNVK